MTDTPRHKGTRFEERVKRLFILLGFEVEIDVLVAGRQVDLMLHERRGALSGTYVVECKDLAARVSVREVDALLSKLMAARSSGYPEARGIFVTSLGFVKEARAHATSLGVQLTTVSELEASLLDLRPLVSAQRDELLADRGVDGFIEPTLRLDGRTSTQPALDLLGGWLKSNRLNQLTLLGDYGTGKTTVLRKFAVELANGYLGTGEPIGRPAPIYVDLRDFSHVISVRQIILDLCDRYRVKLSSYETFSHIFADGRAVLILDGFDELASKSNLAATLRNFRELNRSIVGRAKLILSCRNHYFVNHAEVRSFHGEPERVSTLRAYTELYREVAGRPNFQLAYLDEFDEEKINAFICARKGEQMLPTVARVLSEKYNLADLARRPVLLEMILDSLDEIESKADDITSAVLYQVYTDIWLQRNDWNTVLTPAARTHLIEGLAARVARNPDAGLHYDDIPELVTRVYPELTISEAEQCDRELRRAGFLIRDADGNYRFSHRSFQEFFLARWILSRLAATRETSRSSLFEVSDTPISTEVFRFTSQLMSSDPRAMEGAKALLRDQSVSDADLGLIVKFVARSRDEEIVSILHSLVRASLSDTLASVDRPHVANPPTRSTYSGKVVAYAIVALGRLDPGGAEQLCVDILLGRATTYPVCHNALLALVWASNGREGKLVDLIAVAPATTIAVMLTSDIIAREIVRWNRTDVADALVTRWSSDAVLQVSVSVEAAPSGLCDIWSLSTQENAREQLLAIASRARGSRTMARASMFLEDERLREIQAQIVRACRVTGPSIHAIPVLSRLGTAESILLLIEYLTAPDDRICLAATEALVECAPSELLKCVRTPASWSPSSRGRFLRLRTALSLGKTNAENLLAEVEDILRGGVVPEYLLRDALSLLEVRDPGRLPPLIHEMWSRYKGAGTLAIACEFLYHVDPTAARALAVRGLRARNHHLRQRSCVLLTSDYDEDVTARLAGVLKHQRNRDVRLEAARALVTPGRDLSGVNLQGILDIEEDVEVRDLLAMVVH